MSQRVLPSCLVLCVLVAGCHSVNLSRHVSVFDDVVSKPYVVNVPTESRSISFENPTGAKGKGGMAASKVGVGRKGAALKSIRPGETVTLCDVKGPGVIRRMWVTLEGKKENLLGFVIRGYWEGQTTPSIEAPIGNFFGCAHGVARAYQSAVHAMTDTAGMEIVLPMPFTERVRFTVTNEGIHDYVPFYYQIDLTIHDTLPADVGRLHVAWRRENPTVLGKDFTILPTRTGMGRFMGCLIGINNVDKKWWGEGEFKAYLDGDTEFATIVGTGTEDYIGQAWGFHENAFMRSGVSLRKDWRWTLYRWHLKDPLYWKKDIRITLQQMGSDEEHGGYYNKQEDVSATAFWYEPIPSAPLEPLADYAARVAPGYTVE